MKNNKITLHYVQYLHLNISMNNNKITITLCTISIDLGISIETKQEDSAVPTLSFVEITRYVLIK